MATVEVLEDFASLNAYLYTSILVIAAVHEYLANYLSPSIAKDFIKLLPYTSIGILRPTPKDELTAQEIVTQPNAYNLSFTDALHIAVMRRQNITKAFSTNPHFPQNQISLISS